MRGSAGSVVPLRRAESKGEQLGWQTNAEAGLGVEAKLWPPSRNWTWNDRYGESLMCTAKPLA